MRREFDSSYRGDRRAQGQPSAVYRWSRPGPARNPVEPSAAARPWNGWRGPGDGPVRATRFPSALHAVGLTAEGW